MADNQSQKRCTMDSLKEKDNPAPNPAKRPRIEVDEELMRQMIAGQAPLDSEVVRRIPEPEEEDTNALEENTSETVSGASAPTAEKTGIDSTASTVKNIPASVGKSSRYRILNARSSLRWIAATALRSMSVPEPSTKCRKSSTCWGMKAQGLRPWSTICCGSSWTFTATS